MADVEARAATVATGDAGRARSLAEGGQSLAVKGMRRYPVVVVLAVLVAYVAALHVSSVACSIAKELQGAVQKPPAGKHAEPIEHTFGVQQPAAGASTPAFNS